MDDGIDWHALGLRDASARSYYLLGRALHSSTRPLEQDAAIKALHLAHELQPRASAYTEVSTRFARPYGSKRERSFLSVRVSRQLGIVLKARGWRAEAERMLRKAIAFTPTEPACYLHLGQLVSPKEATSLVRAAIQLTPSSGSAYLQLAAALRQSGELPAAQAAAATAADLAPSDARLKADWRHWHANHERSRQQRLDGEHGAGIGYDSHLQFPWRGLELRAIASSQLSAAYERLPPLPPRRVSSQPQPDARVLPRRKPIRVAYVGSLSDEPQLRAMGALFRHVDSAAVRLSFHPVTTAPTPTPDYLTYWAACRAGAPHGTPAPSAAALTHGIAAEQAHILLDGLWRKGA
jgi:hypothetical protein